MPTDTSAHDKMAAVYADEAAFACQEWAKNAASAINRDQPTAAPDTHYSYTSSLTSKRNRRGVATAHRVMNNTQDLLCTILFCSISDQNKSGKPCFESLYEGSND